MSSGDVIEFPVEYRTGRERYVGKHEIARFLGCSVSWVEKAPRLHGLPSHKIAGKRMFRISEVDAWAHKEEAS
jgi:excisionase family DNA binding protein